MRLDQMSRSSSMLMALTTWSPDVKGHTLCPPAAVLSSASVQVSVSPLNSFLTRAVRPYFMGERYLSQMKYTGMESSFTMYPENSISGIRNRGSSCRACETSSNSVATNMPMLVPTVDMRIMVTAKMKNLPASGWRPTSQYRMVAPISGSSRRAGSSTVVLDRKYDGSEYILLRCSRVKTVRSPWNVETTPIEAPITPLATMKNKNP
mmetsp:Transcript_21120/g.49449  ORF Transcript_21120/g.49449 Transcript_21120/m.49449 type:complete len:207 (+) Transcript_21120:539-1159(+)